LHYPRWSFVYKFWKLNSVSWILLVDCFTTRIRLTIPLWYSSRNHDGAKSKYHKFLTSKSVLTLNHSSYSPDLPCNYFLFSKLKIKPKGKQYFDTFLDIQKASTEAISTISKEDFSVIFLKLYDHCKPLYFFRKGCISNDYKQKFIIITLQSEF